MSISYTDISVIVRGLVVGAGENDERRKFTKRSLESVRRYLPGAEIILSTWKGSDVDGLHYDRVLFSDEPERIEMAFADGRVKLVAANHQIITSQSGLEHVQRKYALVMRSDMVLNDTGFLRYFVKYASSPPIGFLKHKIVVLPTYNPRRVPAPIYNVCDWMYFGYTEDVRAVFEIPLMTVDTLRGEKKGGYYQMEQNSESEQYIWSSFLRKYTAVHIPQFDAVSPRDIQLSEESYARHVIMLPAHKAGVQCLKMPHAGYGARPWLSQGLYTWNEYRRLCYRYSMHTTYVLPHIVEMIGYASMLRMRNAIHQSMPGVYRSIVNMIRKAHGSFNLLK